MEAPARLAARRPVAVCVVAAALVVLGWTSWRQLPLDLLPDLQSPTILVSVRSGDRTPSEMERIYGEQIEQRLFAVRGIREIAQVARTGRIVTTVGFDWDTDMDFALVEVEKAVGGVRSDPDVDEVLVRRFDPRQEPVMVLGLVATPEGPDLAELRRIALRQLAVALERLAGVAEIRVTGGREREVRVEVDARRLEGFGIGLGELEGRLREANVDVNAGTLEEGDRVWLVRGLARYRSPEDVADVVVRRRADASASSRPIRVADVARVGFADRDVTHLVRVDGVEGVGLSVFKEAGANTVAVSRTVREALEDLEDDLPGVRVNLVSDEAALVEDAVHDVQSAALVGITLAILVLVAFLRSVGPTLIVSLAVPTSLLATLFLMHLGGHSLNVMTLGGLALGAGMLVDNAIVVVESIYRRLAGGQPLDRAAPAGVGDVGGAIVASTLTTCAVFLPIVFVRGLAARLVSGLSFSVVVSLIASLFVAIFLIPALAGWLLPRSGARVIDPGVARVERIVAALLRRPAWSVLAASVVVAVALGGLTRLGTELLPPSDPRQFSVRLVGPPGQRVEATARVAGAVEGVLRSAAGDDLRALLSEVGRLPEDDRLLREEQSEENTARVIVRLADDGRAGSRVVAAAAPAVAALGGVEAVWETGGSSLARALGTGGPPIVVEVAGRSLEDLREAAAALVERMRESDALWNVRSSFEGGPPELRVRLEQTLADGLGVDLETIARALEASLDGREVTVVSTGDEEYPVVLRLPRARRDALLDVRVTTSDGRRIAVGDVARLIPEAGAREIYRRDQRRVARVTARLPADGDYPSALAAAREALDRTDLIPGLRARVVGEEAERARTFDELGFAAVLAVLLVFMVLAATFESLVHPVTVVASVPLALVGVAAVLVPTGRPLGVMELLGMIVLAGVAVNDAILLLETARRRMTDGVGRADALAEAAAVRFRPILMTTATTVLALLPLAVATGEAASLRSPLARTIIGGIVASTIGSLLVIPCLYLLIDRLRPGRRGAS